MPNIRLDDYACLYSAPTAIAGENAPKGSVFRPFNDLDQAKAYADTACAWFADKGCPTPVFVVKGPTSTTNAKFEVVDACAGYTVAYKALPPETQSARAERLLDVVLMSDAQLSPSEQAKLHLMSLYDALRKKTELGAIGIARCHAFLERGIPCASIDEDGGRHSSPLNLTAEFLRAEWLGANADTQAIDQLFRAYIKAGYVLMHEPIDQMTSSGSYVKTPTALEYSVFCGNQPLMVALLDNGADETRVPAEPWQVTPERVLAAPGDFYALLDHAPTSNREEMKAAANAALMRRRITDTAGAAGPAGPVDPSETAASSRRSRRLGL